MAVEAGRTRLLWGGLTLLGQDRAPSLYLGREFECRSFDSFSWRALRFELSSFAGAECGRQVGW